MYSFVANVNNAIDISYFGMYFHENESKERLMIYDAEDITKLGDAMNQFKKHYRRNASKINGYTISICVARNWLREDFETCCDLYYEKIIHEYLDKEGLKPVKVNLYILEEEAAYSRNFKEEINYKIIDNECLLKNGYTRRSKYNGFLHETELTTEAGKWADVKLENAKETQENDCGCCYEVDDILKKAAGRLNEQIAASESDIKFESELMEYYAHQYKEFYDKCLQLIEPIVVHINTDNAFEAIRERLALVNFMNSICKENDMHRIEEILDHTNDSYEAFVRDFNKNIDVEKKRIVAYEAELNRQKKYLQDFDVNGSIKDSKPTCNQKEPLEKFRTNMYIGTEKDIDDLLELTKTPFDIDNWEEEYRNIISEIDKFEKELEHFGTKVQGMMHDKNRESFKVIEEVNRESVELAQAKRKKAERKLYQIKNRSEILFSEVLEIANGIQKARLEMIKIVEAKKYSSTKHFVWVFLLAFLSVVIPYFATQPYIVNGMLNGNVVPIICIIWFAVVFVAVKGSINLIYWLKIREITEKIKKILNRYFNDVHMRQELFYETIDAMISLENIENEEKVMNDRLRWIQMRTAKKDYHMEHINGYLKAVRYFDDFVKGVDKDEIFDSGYNGRIENKLNVKLVDNDVYWMRDVR